jgi:hypothetical protein
MRDHELTLNELALDSLRVSAKWCMFLAIVGFIFIGLMLVGGVFATVAMSALSEMPNDPYNQLGMDNPVMQMRSYLGAIYIVMALLYFFPIYYLFNYAKGTKMALESGNPEVLANALKNLKSHHKYLGIVTIIIISLYILAIIGVVIFAASFAGAAAM